MIKLTFPPELWGIENLADIFYINQDTLPASTDPNLQFRYISIEDVTTESISYSSIPIMKFGEAPSRARRVLKDGDILISTVRPNLKAFAIFHKPGNDIWVCSTGFAVLTPKPSQDNYFTFYQLLSDIGSRQFYSYVAGTNYPAINDHDFRMLKVYSAPEKERGIISESLLKTAQAIEEINKSIQKIQQLKKALMQHLLSGRLKPDGTWRTPDEFYVDEKFGRVPKGWRVCAVADPSIADLEPNYDFIKGKEYAFIPMDGLDEGFKGVRQIEYRVIESGGYSRFKNGDILFAKITPCVENGKVAMVEGLKDGLGFGSTEFIVISPKPIVDNWFLYYQLISGNVHRLAISLMEGTTGRQRIPAKIFRKRIFISLPENIDEQKKISEKIKAVEQMITAKQDKITKLQIMKKSLMQNLLTGKIRVQAG